MGKERAKHLHQTCQCARCPCGSCLCQCTHCSSVTVYIVVSDTLLMSRCTNCACVSAHVVLTLSRLPLWCKPIYTLTLHPRGSRQVRRGKVSIPLPFPHTQIPSLATSTAGVLEGALKDGPSIVPGHVA